MNKIVFLVCSIFILHACNKEDITLGSQTKEAADNDIVNTAHPKAKECSETLIGTKAWKMEYKTDNESYNFFFQFEKGDIVESDSDFPESSMYSLYAFQASGDDLVLVIKGGGHFQFLKDEYKEDEFIIKDFSAEKINCVGKRTGKQLELVKTDVTDMENNLAKKILLIDLKNKGVLRGVIRHNDLFIAHYIIDYRKNSIQFTYIKDGNTQHTVRTYSNNGKEFKWDDLLLENYTLTGFSHTNMEPKVLTKDGESTLSLQDNSKILTSFDNRDRQYQLSVKTGVGAAQAILLNETAWDKLKTIELNYTWGKRPVVAVLNSGYLFYDAIDVDNAPAITDVDKITWTNIGGNPLFGGTVEDLKEGNEQLKNFLNAYFDQDGHYVIKETAEGNIYYYMLSATKTAWFKFKQTK